MYRRTRCSISSSDMAVTLPSSYCFRMRLLILATPGWVFSIASCPIRAKWELIQWAMPARPDLSVMFIVIGLLSILFVSKAVYISSFFESPSMWTPADVALKSEPTKG